MTIGHVSSPAQPAELPGSLGRAAGAWCPGPSAACRLPPTLTGLRAPGGPVQGARNAAGATPTISSEMILKGGCVPANRPGGPAAFGGLFDPQWVGTDGGEQGRHSLTWPGSWERPRRGRLLKHSASDTSFHIPCWAPVSIMPVACF